MFRTTSLVATAKRFYALRRLQVKANVYHWRLDKDFWPEGPAYGGDLFLGSCYAQTNRIYFGLNPGMVKDMQEYPFATKLLNPGTGPLYEEEEEDPPQYWRNFRRFFGSPPLLQWMDKTTHAFLIPWRTPTVAALRKARWYERALEYAGDLVRTMIDDHQARIVVVAGKQCLEFLASKWFLDFDWQAHVVEAHGHGTYQWRKVRYGELAIYQLPHFSRANSESRLAPCRAWFVREVIEGGEVGGRGDA